MYKTIRSHWIAFYIKYEVVTYFDSCAVKHISKEIKKLIANEIIKANIYKIRAYNSII